MQMYNDAIMSEDNVNADRKPAKKAGHDNLISIVAGAALIVIVGAVAGVAEFYPDKAFDFPKPAAVEQTAMVQGYVRPGQQPKPQTQQPSLPPGMKNVDLLEKLTPDQVARLRLRFEQGASLLHAKQYEFAITALDDVIRIQPNLPEAYVNLGFAYLGLEQYKTAAGAFDRALQLKPFQLNAYYGLAEALEGDGDIEGALGSMRSYLHLAQPNDPFLPKVRAAIWEWETKLGRTPSVTQDQGNMQFDSDRFVSPHGSAPQAMQNPH